MRTALTKARSKWELSLQKLPSLLFNSSACSTYVRLLKYMLYLYIFIYISMYALISRRTARVPAGRWWAKQDLGMVHESTRKCRCPYLIMKMRILDDWFMHELLFFFFKIIIRSRSPCLRWCSWSGRWCVEKPGSRQLDQHSNSWVFELVRMASFALCPP